MTFTRVPLKFALVSVLMLATTSAYAQLSASLSANVVGEFESVRLEIIDRSGNNQSPDFSPLGNDFEISNTSSSSTFNIVNGRIDSAKSWSVTLTPTRTGTITIPPIVVGNRQTQPLQLRVNPLSSRERAFINEAAFFETIVSHEEQYPQAAIYVTRRLLYSDQTRMPSLPQDKQLSIDSATVLPIGGRDSSRERRGNIDYFVMQWRYVVFAEKSGELTIPGESTRIGVYSNQFRAQVRTIAAEAKTVKILPIPAAYPHDQPWFPASAVTLTQSYDPSGLTTLALGDALTRTIEVRAQNSYESAMLPLELGDIQSLRVYPEQAAVDTVLESDSVWGTQTRTFNLIPVDPGRIELPEFSFTWWDIDAKQLRTATLPATAFDVPDPTLPEGSSSSDELVDTNINSSASESSASDYAAGPWFFILVGFAVLGWLSVLGLIVFMNRDRLRQPIQKITPDRINYDAVREALQTGDSRILRQAILKTISRHLECDSVTARRLLQQSTDGNTLLASLDRASFTDSVEDIDIDFKSLQQVIDSVVNNYDRSETEFGLHSVLN